MEEMQPSHSHDDNDTSDSCSERKGRRCVACYEDDPVGVVYISPCRRCRTLWCTACLKNRFETIATEPNFRPPSCCTLLQPYTIRSELSDAMAQQYQSRWEEWLTPNKIYCPSPYCSAFIPERHVPPSTQDISSLLIRRLIESPLSRFVQLQKNKREGLRSSSNGPKNLLDVKARFNTGKVSTFEDLCKDLETLIDESLRGLKNSRSTTPYVTTLHFQTFYQSERSEAMQKLSIKHFPCPKCRVAICNACKQIEHPDRPCPVEDTDWLRTLHYKQCPHCKHASKKMFGCQHVDCPHCGAHWCWGCGKGLGECDSYGEGCGSYSEDSGDDDQDAMSEDDNHDHYDDPEQPRSNVHAGGNVSVANESTVGEFANNDSAPSNTTNDNPRNLDSGGERRWGHLNLGSEPVDEWLAQPWACKHAWEKFRMFADEADQCDPSFLECNFCFAPVAPAAPVTKSTKNARKPLAKKAQQIPQPYKLAESPAEQAWECGWCSLVACVKCKDQHTNAKSR